ncbi:MAG: helix-turn-helix transcriptional regulator, partial [Pseudomonadota bacterium]
PIGPTENKVKDLNAFFALWIDVFRINRKTLAAELGVSVQHLGRLETGKSQLHWHRLDTLAALSKCSVDTLLLAYMLMDEDADTTASRDGEISSDIGQRLKAWLKTELASQIRPGETHSLSRTVLTSGVALDAAMSAIERAKSRLDSQARRDAAGGALIRAAGL